ncbi:MAG: hypothetical protein JO292_12590 [Betaproteobacteria bacterium]|nr:hypothetical protein [Betaproteobacteria bacterium]
MLGSAGLIAWLLVVLAIVGVMQLMRFLAVHDGLGLGFRQLALIVAASVVVLLLAGGGGLLLMRAA